MRSFFVSVGFRATRFCRNHFPLSLAVLVLLLAPAALHAQFISYAGVQSVLAVTGLSNPTGVAIDGAGNRYIIVNGVTANVIKIAANGAQSTVSLSSALEDAKGIAADSAGNLYFADTGDSRVIKAPAGTGTVTILASSLSSPQSVAVDSAGNVYYVEGNGHVTQIAAAGGALTQITGVTFGNAVAVDTYGNVYIADTGTDCLVKVPAGTSAGSDSFCDLLSAVNGLAVDKFGNIFVTTPSGTLAEYGATGGASVRFLGSGFDLPVSIAVDGAGNVYLVDFTLNQIDIVAPGAVDIGQANVCPASGTQTTPCSQSLTLNFNVLGGRQSLSSVEVKVSIQGLENLDFSTTANTCTGNFSSNTTCSVTVQFAPTAPGVRLGAVDVVGIVGPSEGIAPRGSRQPHSSGLQAQPDFVLPAGATELATVYVHGLASGPLANFDAGIIDTPPIKFGADPYPLGVAPDSGGNLYIADAQSCVILAFIPPSTTVTVAGNGSCGPPSGDGGIATDASINGTYKLAVDSRGNLYISDYQDGIIRKVDGITGIITTIAGQSGVHAHTDDGVPAISATLQRPQGLTVDGSGNLFFADQTDYTVRRIDASSGILTTVAGNFASGRGYSGDGGAATSAQLKFPNAVAVDSAGNLFISDEGNNVIRKVTASSGIITTVAGQGPPAAGGYGGDGGPATSALLMAPSGVVVDAAGNFYIADSKNALVRKVNAQSGIITSAAGIFTGSDEYTGDGGAATLAGLSRFKDVALDASGNIYLADTNNGVVREVAAASGIAAFGSFDVGISSAAIDVTLINNGNAALNLSALAPSTNFNLSGPDTTCTTSSVLTPSGSCILGIEFLPTVAGSLTGTLTLTDNTGNNSTSTQSVALSGTGLPANADKLAISGVSSTLSDGGNLGTIQVSVESNNGIVVTGSTASITVTITGPNGYLQQVTAAAVNGVATFNLSSLVFSTDGSYQVTATSNDLSQASAPFAVTGSLQPAKLFLPALPATVAVGENLGIVPVSVETSGGLVVTNSTASITVTITGPNGFSQQVTANAADGIATFDLSTLAFSTAGSYTITATSSGLTQASASFTVTASAAEAAKLALPTIPAVVAVGENLGIVPVSVETSSGSVVVTSTALVTITITFPDDSTQVFTTAAVSGIASFNMGTLKLSQPGSYLITATSTGLTLASAAFTVTSSAADAAKLALPTIPATVAVGDSLGAVPVSVETSTGSVVTSSTASVTATITGPNGYLQSVTATAVNGIAIFNLSSLTFSTAGSYTITATGVGLTPASASFIVTASASEPAKLALPAIPASVAVGENLGNIPVSVETNSGGVVTSSSAIVTITITGPNGYLQTIMATAANGIASFNLSNLTLTSAGSYTITASSIGLSPASVTFTVTASTAEQANLALSTIPAAVGQSTSLGTVQVSVETSGGAVVTDSTASITLTITGPNGYSQTLTVAAVNGVATFDTTAFAFSALGNYTVTASSTGLTSAVAAFIVEQDFSLTPSSGGTNPAPTQDVLPGAAAAYQLQLAPAGATFNAPITLSATGLPPGATYTFNPAVVTPGTAAATTTFTVDTAKTTASLRPRQNMIWGFAALLPAMFLVPWTSPQRRRKTRRFLMLPLLLGLLSLGIVGITGCGAGGLFGQPQTSYTITVTGTSGALTHSTTVTLIVQ